MAVRTAPSTFRHLPPEPWGRRLLRARVDLCDLSLDEATALAGHWMLTTATAISRLERSSEVPVGPRARGRRQLAYVLCLCYLVDPADFDLGPGDLPPGITIPARTWEDGRLSSTKWLTHTMPVSRRFAS